MTLAGIPRILLSMGNAEDRQTPGPVPLNPGTKIAEVRVRKRAVYLAVAMVARLRGFSDDMLIVDHPSEPGFDVYAPESAT